MGRNSNTVHNSQQESPDYKRPSSEVSSEGGGYEQIMNSNSVRKTKSSYTSLDLQMTEVDLKWTTVLADFTTLGFGGACLLILFVAVKPFRRGFYCDDESIRYPFHQSTVPNWALYIYTFSIPLLTIALTEFFSHRRSSATGSLFSRPFPAWLIYTYRSLVDFVLGCVTSQLVTDIGKYTIGRLRPNFIDVCKPNVTLDHCSMYGNQYITQYYCQSGPNDAKESRVSFPSGHSSFSAYTMLYVAIYIQIRWRATGRRSHLRLIKCAVQLCLVLIAYFTALSRVMDNKHHWSDVSAGSLIGVVTASLTARYVSTLMNGREASSGDDQDSTNRRPTTNYDLEAHIPKDQPTTRDSRDHEQ